MGIEMLSVTPALAGLVVPRKLPRAVQTWLLAALAGVLFLWLLTYLPILHTQGPVEINYEWVPELGLTLSFYLDGLALLFGLIITGVGTAIFLYAGYYFDDAQERGRFYNLILPFMSAMLALVLAGNILTLFIAWELTSILSFLLISFTQEKEEARNGALQALIITGGGGLALFVGLMLLGAAAGTTQISQILTNDTLRSHPYYTALTVLILIGCFTKSAQFPFHFWLPGAMSAPTPASAYLHSATMVKAGIYLLVRLYPVLSGTPLWQNALLAIGLTTMGLGALYALRQSDLKAALAYSTISQLGALTALLALPEGEGIKAALVGIIAHSLYKASLFLMVGAVDHHTGTRNLNQLGGLRRTLPGWAVITLLASLSMAGFPPLLGFVAKETLLEAMLTAPIGLIIVVFSAVLTIAMALILMWKLYFGAVPKNSPLHADAHPHLHALPSALIIGPAALMILSLLTGLFVDSIVSPIIEPTLEQGFHLALFSGFNFAFFLSLIALPSGIMLFITRPLWIRDVAPVQRSTGAAAYRGVIGAVERVGDVVLRSQGGKLRYYLIVILAAAALLMSTAGLTHIAGVQWSFQFNGDTDILKTVLLVVALIAMVGSIVFKRHLVAALSLGVAGYSIGGVFLLEPAPDVALVQFLVETIGTVLLIVMLAKISAPARQRAIDHLWASSKAGMIRDIVISAVVGIGVTLFTLAAVLNRPAVPTITEWQIANALPALEFPDIVGAIVTDFRGMDTIIEITVFGMAAIGVFTLLTAWNVQPKNGHPIKPGSAAAMETIEIDAPDTPAEPTGSRLSTPLTRTIAQIVLPFALLLALAQLLYGGDGPGDGFTAGVTSGLGVALWYVVFGYHETRQRLTWLRPRRLIGAGIGLVVLNAAVPLLFGLPFLTHTNFDFALPAHLHLTSTFFYESGIFLTVFGSTSMVLEAIAHPREIEPL
ncbi:MAG: hydrogen gas-evolving membrane-bound hydrogenase subunit E [Anaerolineae bacterium]